MAFNEAREVKAFMRNKAEGRSRALSETGRSGGQGTHAGSMLPLDSRSGGSRWWGWETGRKNCPGGWGQMPLRGWCKQLWDTNTDKRRGVGGNLSPRCKKKGDTRGGRVGGRGEAERPQRGEWCWLKTKTSKSLAGKSGTSSWHG